MDPLLLSALISGGATLASTIFGQRAQKKQMSQLTGAQREANAFNAQQAEISRDWSENMYQQYESPAAQVSQYRAAGINPAAMYGSMTPGSMPSGDSATSVSPDGDPGAMLGFLASMANIAADVQLKQSQVRLNESKSKGQDIENQFKPAIFEQNLRKGEIDIQNTIAGIRQIDSQISLNSANIERIASDIKLNDAEIKNLLAETDKKVVETATEKLRQANIEASTRNIAASTLCEIQRAQNLALDSVLLKQQEKLNAANIRIANADAVYAEYKQAFREYNGYNPDQPIYNALTSAIGQLAYDINPANWFKKRKKD